MREAVIIDAVRTPIGKGHPEKGALRGHRPDELYAHVINAILERTGIDPKKINEVVTGCVTQTSEQGNNVSRMAMLLSNLPDTTNAFSVARACGSAQEAIHLASLKVIGGDADYTLGGGVESMSHVPMFSDIGAYDKVNPALKEKLEIIHQGESAERLCEIHGITRSDMDQFSAESHRKASAARKAGYFKSQIAPISALDLEGNSFIMDYDEGIRDVVDLEKMGQLPLAFREPGKGNVTGGNASQISDGAGIVLIADKETAIRDGFKPRARIVSRACAAGDATLALMEVIPATQQALQRAGLSINDIDVFEINEAFANVPIIWQKELGIDPAKVNPNGGAVAHGHPLGATGAILMTKLLNELERTGKRYGLQTMCIAQGMATATVIERLD